MSSCAAPTGSPCRTGKDLGPRRLAGRRPRPGVLVRVLRRARESGGDLSLAAPQQQVRRVLGITGLIDVFSVYPSVKQAVSGAKLARPLPAPAL